MKSNLTSGILILFSLLAFITLHQNVVGKEEFVETEFTDEDKPKVFDSNLKISKIADGLNTPTTMAFIGNDDR